MHKNSGLVSISFRNKTVDELITMCKSAELKYIEWGSDVHCPAGNIDYARKLCEKTRNAGLIPYCYGSYFRVGITDNSEFENYCLTAKALGAECIRVWAYNKNYNNCSDDETERTESCAEKIFEIAKNHNLSVSFEYHRSCLTEKIDGALKLISKLPKDTLKIHWQPNPEISVEDNLKELRSLPHVDIVHVFAWTREGDKDVRHPLYSHRLTWKNYIRQAKEITPGCIFELEFFKDDSTCQFHEDAKTLNDILNNAL